ncbi:hypothetical protein N9917_03225 [Deltaproteobacteria bacterium]|nr:hypothetical protein [Deltaproteobacteria bacterium]
MSLRRQAIKLAASLPKGAERTALLNTIAASDKEAGGCGNLAEGLRQNCEDMKAGKGPGGKGKGKAKKKDDKKDDGKMPADLLESFKKKKAVRKPSKEIMDELNGFPVGHTITHAKGTVKKTKGNPKDGGVWEVSKSKSTAFKADETIPGYIVGRELMGKKGSRSILASFRGPDSVLAREVVKLASRLPEHRSTLLNLIRQAAGEEEDTVKTPGWDASEISEVEKGPLEQDADEAYMKPEFKQQEFHELGDKQESGELAKGSDEQKKYAKVARAKKAATKSFRRNLIRMASDLPKGSRSRQDLLHLLAS